MAWLDGEIVFSNTWKDTRSRVYRIAPDSMSVKAYFDMPSEAVHTSGLESDGKYLWAVDFISNKAYKIDWAPSFSAQVAHVIGSFDTTLRGTSACGIVSLRGEKLLAMSDFRCSKRTIFVRHEAALAARSARDAIVFSYRNEGFSQGLAFDGQYLFESEKKFGVGVINKMDLSLLLQKGNARHATIRQYPAPSTGVEDLAWDGTHLWTSDESTFRFYTARLK
jgi:glutamine cyclotransferase